MTVDTSLSIAGPNSLTQAQISAWYHGLGKGNGNLNGVSVDQVIGYYLTEGSAQGIRGDFAFAQACWETGYFTSPDTSLNNYAGIGHPVSAPSGLDFASPQIGVRAQIQLLAKAVAGNNVTLAEPNVGVNWESRQVTTVGGLSGNWAQDPNYATELIDVFNSMVGGLPVAPAGGIPIPIPGVTGGGTPPPAPGFVMPAVAALPAVNDTWQATLIAPPLNFMAGAGPHLADAVTTDSTVDFTSDQLGQVQLTICDPDLTLTSGIAGQIVQTSGVNQVVAGQVVQVGGIGQQVMWGTDVMTIAEAQTTEISGGIPGMIVTLRTAVLQWMATARWRRYDNGLSATDWLAARVAEYNTLISSEEQPAKFLGMVTQQRPQIALNPSMSVTQWQSYYDMAQELCMEEGCWLLECNGGVFFGKPTWFATIAPGFQLKWEGLGTPFVDSSVDAECMGVPVCLRSTSMFTGDTVMVKIPHDIGEQVRPGQQFGLAGVPGFPTDQWLVTRVQWNTDGQATPVTVYGNQIKDPVPSAPGGVQPFPPQVDPTGNPPIPTNLQFLQVAQKEIGVPYVWGGITPAGFDCSGLVMWSLQQLGIPFPHYSGAQYQACVASPGQSLTPSQAMNIRGALLFKNQGAAIAGDHVAISMGDGTHVLQAPYPGQLVQVDVVPASYFDVAAQIPFLNYGGGS